MQDVITDCSITRSPNNAVVAVEQSHFESAVLIEPLLFEGNILISYLIKLYNVE